MEATAQCISYAKLFHPLISTSRSKSIKPPPASLFPSKTWLFASSKEPICVKFRNHKHGRFGVISASTEDQNLEVDDVADQTWLLEPIGDGDWRHIGYKVKIPGAYEISSSEVTIGRLPEKSDIVIPVATVSGLHARIQKKGGRLYITDLDSTNGTFIDENRLIPGVIANVLPGSRVTFGDTHLAIFRVSKLERSSASLAAEEPLQEPKETAEPEGAVESGATKS